MSENDTAAGRPDRASRGIFLPSMRWTFDRRDVEREQQRLLAMQRQLSELVVAAQELDGQATWCLIAEASLAQLDSDIDDLFEWLEAREPRS